MKNIKKLTAVLLLCAVFLSGAAAVSAASPKSVSFGGGYDDWYDDFFDDDYWGGSTTDNAGGDDHYGDINDEAYGTDGDNLAEADDDSWSNPADADGEDDDYWNDPDDADDYYPSSHSTGSYQDIGRTGSSFSFLGLIIGAVVALLMTVIVKNRYRNAGAGTVYNLTANTRLELNVRRDDLVDRKVTVERNYYAPRN